MYKSFIRIVAAVMILAAAYMRGHAETHMVIHFKSGETAKVNVSNGLKVTFGDSEMAVVSLDDSTIYSLDSVSRLSYIKLDSSEVEEIDVKQAPVFTFTLSGIEVNAEGRHRVDVTDTAGRVIMTYQMTDNLFIPKNSLPAGVAIITVDTSSAFKFAIR